MRGTSEWASAPFWASTPTSLVVAAYVGLFLHGYFRGIAHLGGWSALFLVPPFVSSGIILRQIQKNRPQPVEEGPTVETQARPVRCRP